jgi:uncharacterized protein YndB with AHSA1/START domain
MREFSVSIGIDAPTERVWEVMSDTSRWHEWTASITSVELAGDGKLAVGNVAHVRQPKLPPATWKVTAVEPPVGFTWVSTGPGVRVTAHHRIEAVGDRSKATLSLELQGIFAGLLAWITGSITERYLALEARGLKARSETPGFHV